MLREYRGDAHIAAAAAAGFDGCDLQVLTERCAGMPPRSPMPPAGAGMPPSSARPSSGCRHAACSTATVRRRPAWRRARPLEAETDRLCVAMVDALGDDVVELVGRLQAWGSGDPGRRRLLPVVAAGGRPRGGCPGVDARPRPDALRRSSQRDGRRRRARRSASDRQRPAGCATCWSRSRRTCTSRPTSTTSSRRWVSVRASAPTAASPSPSRPGTTAAAPHAWVRSPVTSWWPRSACSTRR